jgi:Rab GDP dissociation inhibitor
MVSDPHQACKKGFYVAIISATVETSNPEAELKPAFDILGTIREKFITVKYFLLQFEINHVQIDLRYL